MACPLKCYDIRVTFWAYDFWILVDVTHMGLDTAHVPLKNMWEFEAVELSSLNCSMKILLASTKHNAVFRQNHKNPSLPGKEFHSCCITCYQWEMDVVFLLCQQIPSIESNICWIKSIVVNSLFGVVKWRCWLLTWKFRCVLLGVTWSLYLSQAAHWSLYVLQRSGAVLGP